MPKFTDRNGHEWPVEITTGHLKALRSDFGIDLKEALKPDGGKLTEAIDDPEKLGQILWVLVGDKATAAGLSPEEFSFLFHHQAVHEAQVAIFEAAWLFSEARRLPRPRFQRFGPPRRRWRRRRWRRFAGRSRS